MVEEMLDWSRLGDKLNHRRIRCGIRKLLASHAPTCLSLERWTGAFLRGHQIRDIDDDGDAHLIQDTNSDCNAKSDCLAESDCHTKSESEEKPDFHAKLSCNMKFACAMKPNG